MGKKYVIYIRVSTEEQARFGVSLEAMLEKCKHYIEAQEDATLVEVFEDRGYSGTLCPAKRPALNKLLEEVRAKTDRWDVVLVFKLDRISRALRDALEIEHVLRKAGKGLESVMERLDTLSASGRMFFNTIASFAEFESAQIGERTWATMSTQVGKRHLGGLPPLGYVLDKDGRYQIENKGAAVVRIIFEQFLKRKGYNKVAQFLNAKNITTASGKHWSHRQVGLILSNPAYAGDRVWARTNRRMRVVNPTEKWIVRDGAHESIVSKDVFEKVQKICRG